MKKVFFLLLLAQSPIFAQCGTSVRLNVFNLWPQEGRTFIHASGYTRGQGNLNSYDYKSFRLDPGSNLELYRQRIALVMSAQASGKFVFIRHAALSGTEYPIIELAIGSDPYMFDCPHFPQ